MTKSDNRTAPVVGWDTLILAQTSLLLRLHHVTSEAQLKGFYAETAKADQLNAILTPQQALVLATDLTNAANTILGQKIPPQSQQS